MELARLLPDFYLLVKVIDAGSFSAAAREIGTTRSLISRHIIQLEEALGTRLLFRDARRFAVTAAGEAVYRQALAMNEAARAAVAAARGADQGVRGLLRLGTGDTCPSLLDDALTRFLKEHRETELAVSGDDGYEVLLRQKIDILLHPGAKLPDSADIVAHPLARLRLVMVGSPALSADLATIRSPAEVPRPYRLAYTGHGLAADWALKNETGTRQPSPRLSSDRVQSMINAARTGMGLVQLPLYACQDALATGQLRTFFEAFEPEPLPLYALTTPGYGADKARSLFIRFLRARLSDMQEQGVLPPEWAEADGESVATTAPPMDRAVSFTG